MSEPRILVAVVDDDSSVRESLPHLVRALGYAVRTFAWAEEFLTDECLDKASCLIVDIGMPGMSGLELSRTLHERRLGIATIVMTGKTDERMRRYAMASGAVAFLFKPFSEAALQEAIDVALRNR
jgi:FixJ family two-component response regulator